MSAAGMPVGFARRARSGDVPYLEVRDYYTAGDAGDYGPAAARAIARRTANGGRLELVLPNRAEEVRTAIPTAPNTTIRGGGSATELVKGGTISLVAGVGVHGAKANLGVDALKGQNAVTLPAGAGAAFSRGDLFGVESTTFVYGTAGRSRDIRRVTAVAGDVVSLDAPLIFDFLVSATAQYWRPEPVKGFGLRDFRVSNEDPTVNTGYAVSLRLFEDLLIRDVTLDDAGGGFSLYDVVGGSVVDPVVNGLRNGHAANLGLTGLGYGVLLAGATSFVTVRGVRGHNCRHLVTTLTDNSRGDGTLWGGPRDCLIADGVGAGSPTSLAIFDSHEYGSFITFENCIAEGAGDGHPGIQIRASDVTLANCRSFRNRRNGVRVDPLAQRATIWGGEYAYNDLQGVGVGAISLSGPDAKLIDAEIHHNQHYGVVMGPTGANPLVQGCHIHHNGQAPVASRGIFDQGATNPIVRDCIIPFDSATTQKTAIQSAGATMLIDGLVALGYGLDSEVFLTPNAAAKVRRLVSDAMGVRVVTNANYTMLPYDRLVLVTTSATGRTITLPSAASLKGERVDVVKEDAGVGTVTLSGTINGAASLVIPATQWAAASLVSDGSTWRKVTAA